jgi:hypothetical protein
MSNLTVSTISGSVASGNKVSIPSGQVLYAPGHVIQMVNTTIYTPTAVSIPANYQANTNIPDLTCSITPKATTSKVYVMVRWFGEWSIQTTNWDSMFGLKRNGTPVGVNPSSQTGSLGISQAALGYYSNDGNSTPEMLYFDFFDSPASTSAVTYQVYANAVAATTLYTNRTVGSGATSFEYGSSTVTLWEIAQ